MQFHIELTEKSFYLQKESAAYWEKRMELVGQLCDYAKRRKELMAPAVHQVFQVIEGSGDRLSCTKRERIYPISNNCYPSGWPINTRRTNERAGRKTKKSKQKDT